MAKLILKVNYYKPGRTKSMGGYAKYIATREQVEKLEDNTIRLKMTEKQEELIAKLVKDFPESVHSEEYLLFKAEPTQANASEYITRTLEDNLPVYCGVTNLRRLYRNQTESREIRLSRFVHIGK